jgi:hypothetical protein
MLISAREAARHLTTRDISWQQSREVLLTGLAGSGVCARGARFYDGDRVGALAARPVVDEVALLAQEPGGVLVARVGRVGEISVPDPAEGAAATMCVRSGLGLEAWLGVRAHLDAHERMPFVATVCGFPVLVADVVRIAATPGPQVELEVEPAGPWRRLVDGRRLVTRPGPTWLLLGHRPSLGRARQAAGGRGERVGAARSASWTRWA